MCVVCASECTLWLVWMSSHRKDYSNCGLVCLFTTCTCMWSIPLRFVYTILPNICLWSTTRYCSAIWGLIPDTHTHTTHHTHTATPELRLSAPLNTLFMKQFVDKLRELAPTEVPLLTEPSLITPSHPHTAHTSPSLLIQRLLSSDQLAEFCKLCGIGEETGDRLGWRCQATAPSEEDDTLCMVLVCNTFIRRPSTEGELVIEDEEDGKGKDREGGGGEKEGVSDVFLLPVLVLHCDQEILLDPDPATPTPPSLLPDFFQHLTLPLSSCPSPSLSQSSAHTTPTPTPSPQTSIDASTTKQTRDPLAQLYSVLAKESLRNLVSKLRTLHFSSYLHAIHTTLAQKHALPPSAFLAAADICSRSTLILDCTPLVGALCRHTHLSLISPPSDTLVKQESSTSTETYTAATDNAEESKTTTNGVGSTTVPREGSVEADEQHLPFGPETMSHLIQTTASLSAGPIRTSCYRLHLTEHQEEERGAPPHCVQREGEPQKLFQTYLMESGFESVPHCTGYYWLRREEKESQRKAKKLSRAGESAGEEDVELGTSSHSEASTIQRRQSLTIDTTLQTGGLGTYVYYCHYIIVGEHTHSYTYTMRVSWCENRIKKC